MAAKKNLQKNSLLVFDRMEVHGCAILLKEAERLRWVCVIAVIVITARNSAEDSA